MTNQTLQPFSHRLNNDGSWDSICLGCFATAARAAEEQSLHPGESDHRCDACGWSTIQTFNDAGVGAI